MTNKCFKCLKEISDEDICCDKKGCRGALKEFNKYNGSKKEVNA